MIKQIIGKENVKVGMKCFEVIQNKANDNEKIELSIFVITEEPRRYFSNDGYFTDYFMKIKYSYLVYDLDMSLQDSGIIPNSYNNHKAYSYDFESELKMVKQMTYGEFKQFINTNKGEKKMKEEIQYKIVDIEKDIIVKIQITKQTHVCIKDELSVILIKASNGLVLMSEIYPAYYGDDRFYLRGIEKERDDNIIAMPLSIFEKFKVAVKEYNNQDNSREFKKALPNVLVNFDKWNSIMNKKYSVFKEKLKEIKDMHEFHKLKFNFLEEILKEFPIKAEYCLDCELDDSECLDCEFKEKNGICEERKSKWYKIYELRNKLIDAINEIVY
jgi:hypothetical protein